MRHNRSKSFCRTLDSGSLLGTTQRGITDSVDRGPNNPVDGCLYRKPRFGRLLRVINHARLDYQTFLTHAGYNFCNVWCVNEALISYSGLKDRSRRWSKQRTTWGRSDGRLFVGRLFLWWLLIRGLGVFQGFLWPCRLCGSPSRRNWSQKDFTRFTRHREYLV